MCYTTIPDEYDIGLLHDAVIGKKGRCDVGSWLDYMCNHNPLWVVVITFRRAKQQ